MGGLPQYGESRGNDRGWTVFLRLASIMPARWGAVQIGVVLLPPEALSKTTKPGQRRADPGSSIP